MATMDEWNSISGKKYNVSSPKVVNRTQGTYNGVDVIFERYLNKVLQTKKFGIMLGSIELRNVTASCRNGKGDRFKISIPYANQTLEWTVIFNSTFPEMGPDFEFSDKSFLADPALALLQETVPSLCHWDHLKDDSLLKVLTELVIQYKQHQIDQLNEIGENLYVDYKNLVESAGICEDDIELLLLPDSVQPEEAHFLIRIDIDFSKLPGKHNFLDNDSAMLHITYYGPQWNRGTPQLYFSKNLEEIFGNSNNFHLPPYIQDKFLMDYVPIIKKFINDKMNSIITNYEKKKNFIKAILFLQRQSVIEYDSVEYTSITLLLENRDFHFLVNFSLSPGFPKDQPKITLQSIYHTTSKNELYKHVLISVPYSPRWEPAMMVKKALTHIIENEINKFKMNSTQKKR